MAPDIIINGIQLDTYLKQYKINTYLDLIHYKESYELSNYISTVNTSIFYKDEKITDKDIQFNSNITNQEKELVLIALNKLRERVI